MHRNVIFSLVGLIAGASACGRPMSSIPVTMQDGRVIPAEDSILGLQHEWVQTALRGEAERSAALMADDFRLVGPRGRVVTKQQWVETMLAQRKPAYDSVTYDRVHVALYGDHAVISGGYTQRTTSGEQRITGQGVFVSTWVREGTRWRVLASVYPGPARHP